MIKPNKLLGQNFLNSAKIAEEIVEAGDVKPDDIILEVGPGKGVLTELLLKKAKKVIAVEKDEKLADFLRGKFAEEIKNGKLELVSGDILKFNPMSRSHLDIGGYKIIANLPYYLTSFFLRKFLSGDFQPSLMVLMIQKEVAERIVGVGRKKNLCSSKTVITGNFSRTQVFFPAKESLLSISVKAYGKPEIIRKVSAGNFSPAPKVDSAVIKISGISKDFFKPPLNLPLDKGEREGVGEKYFFELIKKGFSQKRKMLINNLGMDSRIFDACAVPHKARAENLRLDDWKCLANANKK